MGFGAYSCINLFLGIGDLAYQLPYFFSKFAEMKSGIEVVPVFISVDPERDTVEQVREYVKGKFCFDVKIQCNAIRYQLKSFYQFLYWKLTAIAFHFSEFHPKLIGLTGSPDEIKKTARAYRVYYMKTEEEGSDYLVDHSIVMYV